MSNGRIGQCQRNARCQSLTQTTFSGARFSENFSSRELGAAEKQHIKVGQNYGEEFASLTKWSQLARLALRQPHNNWGTR